MKAVAIVGGNKMQRTRSRDGRKLHPNINNIAIDSWKFLVNT